MDKKRTHRQRRSLASRLTQCLLAILCLALFGCTRDGEYPNRPITLICPWAAGGGSDTVAREIAFQLEREMGVPVNVVNVTGGAGVTGHTRGALARADGYTLTMATVELNILHWRGLTSVSPADFRPLALINKDAAALFVRTDSRWTRLEDLASEVRASPGKLNASGTAQGGIWHLGLAGWLQHIGLKPDAVNWISINGAAPSLQELIAGGLDLVACSLPEARTLMNAGQVRCLGVMSRDRLEQFPGVPTFREQGVDWVMEGWRGIAVPAGTPDDVVLKAAEALKVAVNGEPFREFMNGRGFNWSFEGPEEFSATLKRMDRQFGDVLTSDAFRSAGKRVVGPMFFPAILGIAGALVFVILLAQGGFRPGSGEEAERLSSYGLLRSAEVIGSVVLYLLLVEWAGFILTAGLLLIALMIRLGTRPGTAVLASVILVPALYQIFGVLLRVPLPRGWLGW